MPTLSQFSEMTPGDLRERFESRGYLRQIDMAEALKISQAAVSDYLSGKAKIPGWMDVAMNGLPKRRNGDVVAPRNQNARKSGK